MTENKRFTTKNIICSNYCVWDNNDKPYGNDEVVELLNALHEENEQLKQSLKNKMDSDNYWEQKATEKIKELRDENEQLKKELYLIDKLIEDLGHEEMKRQYEEICGDSDD